LQLHRLPVDFERRQPVQARREAVKLISLRIAAERRDVERSVVEQVFQLLRELWTTLGSLRGRHSSQIEIEKRLRIVARVAGFQKMEN